MASKIPRDIKETETDKKKRLRNKSRSQKQTGQWDFVLSDCLARDYCIALKFCICCYPCSMNQLRAEIQGRRASSCSIGFVNFLVPCLCPHACHTRTLFRNKNNIPGNQINDCVKTILCPHLSAIQIANQMDLNAATKARYPSQQAMI